MQSVVKHLKKSIFLLFLIVLHSFLANAQSSLTISGVVLDEQGAPLRAATVFINGSTKVTLADDEGKFIFQNTPPGSYQVSVQMLGHYPATQDITVTEKPVDIKIWLKVKPTVLKEVVVGERNTNTEFYKLFKQELLGMTENGQSCMLLNPEIVSLNANKQFLNADADDFLVVINKRLGYRIRYQLKYFKHYRGSNYSSIAGDAVFEELWGTDEMKKEWAQNRAEIYKESLRHFLRAVYKGTVLKEGFVVHELYPAPPIYNNPDFLYIGNHPVNFDTLTRVVDTAYKEFHFKSLYANYDPVEALAMKYQYDSFQVKPVKRAVTSILIELQDKPVLIDRAGTCVNCGMHLNGKWGLQRLGDQLPSDYEPDKPPK